MIKKEILNFYFPIIKKYKTLFILMGISGLISGVVTVGMPILFKIETDQLVSQKGFGIFSYELNGFEVFILILGIILLVNIIEKILCSITNIFTSSKRDLLKNEIQFSLFKRMENMEIGRSMSSRYKYISIIIDDNFPSFSDRIIGLPHNSIEFIIQIIGITAVYAYFNFKLLLLVIISCLVGYFIDFLSRKISQKYEIDRKFSIGRQIYKYSNLFLFDFTNLAISGGLNSTIKEYSSLLNEENKNSIKRDFSSLIWSINSLINYNLRDILLKLVVGYGVFAGTTSVGMVVLVVTSMGTLGSIISQIFNFRNDYKDFVFQQESIMLMLKICIDIGNEEFNEKIENVEFKNIDFSYPNLTNYEKEYIEIVQKNIIGKNLGDSWLDQKIKGLIDAIEEESKIELPQIFSNISFNLEKGKVYGIVGKNGAGKTTLMYMLSGFFRTYSGDILYNSKVTKDFTTNSFLNKISFLTQTPFILDWNSTVKENLFLGANNNISEEKAWEYLEIFGLAKKIKKHKKQLDAEIGNDIEFSGGEKQIITFIRLLLQDKDIIIMDEGTNQLDAENEILVMNELLKHKKDKIIIFITHRMSTISKADVIYTLENGKISHSGTHKELLEEGKNAYSRFYKAQILHE